MHEITHDLYEKKEKLEALLREFGQVAVAFSAGVDSAFLLKTAHDVLGDRVLAVTARAVSVPQREWKEAAAFCQSRRIRHIAVDVDQLAIKGFADNPPDRCYHCKKALFTALAHVTRQMGFPILAEGTNADDDASDRPGMRALRELDVRSPLMEAGLTKQDIRILSREAGLATWDKPSLACLATRIPFGEPITAQKLALADAAETVLLECGFRQVRVRMHGKLARIEIEPCAFDKLAQPDLRQTIVRKFSDLGFDYVTLDLHGYTYGSMNKTVQN